MFSPICSQFTIQRGAVVIGKMGNKNWKKATTACDPAVADKHNNWYIFSPVLCDLYWVSTSKSEYYAILKKLFMVNNEILFRSNDRMRKETTLFLYHLVSTAASKTTEMRTKPHLFFTLATIITNSKNSYKLHSKYVVSVNWWRINKTVPNKLQFPFGISISIRLSHNHLRIFVREWFNAFTFRVKFKTATATTTTSTTTTKTEHENDKNQTQWHSLWKSTGQSRYNY